MGSKSGLALFIVLSLNVLFGTAILLPDEDLQPENPR